MRTITDFHLHSKWSRACSKELTLPNIARTCERKGIQLVGTSDFTHPAWRKDIGEELDEAGGGAFALKDKSSRTRFLLSSELSCIYKRGGKVRRVHHLVVLPTVSAVDHLIASLVARGCNVKSDGRPILGLDSEELLKLVLDADPRGLLIPAHAWTPWFAVFGSQSGFDALTECFGEMTPHIHAIETGLSSDPAMNRRLSKLDSVFLVSNSDAHSLDKLGREANVFEMEQPGFDELHSILTTRDRKRFIETIEFFPEEGKYHVDGHRVCDFWCEPQETKRRKGLCPKCGMPLTVGVMHRVDDLADREAVQHPDSSVPYRSIVPLAEVVADAMGKKPAAKAVKLAVDRLVAEGRTEFGILLDEPLEELLRATSPEVVEAIKRMREGKVSIRPGYDGVFGEISLIDHQKEKAKQAELF